MKRDLHALFRPERGPCLPLPLPARSKHAGNIVALMRYGLCSGRQYRETGASGALFHGRCAAGPVAGTGYFLYLSRRTAILRPQSVNIHLGCGAIRPDRVQLASGANVTKKYDQG